MSTVEPVVIPPLPGEHQGQTPSPDIGDDQDVEPVYSSEDETIRQSTIIRLVDVDHYNELRCQAMTYEMTGANAGDSVSLPARECLLGKMIVDSMPGSTTGVITAVVRTASGEDVSVVSAFALTSENNDILELQRAQMLLMVDIPIASGMMMNLIIHGVKGEGDNSTSTVSAWYREGYILRGIPEDQAGDYSFIGNYTYVSPKDVDSSPQMQ